MLPLAIGTALGTASVLGPTSKGPLAHFPVAAVLAVVGAIAVVPFAMRHWITAFWAFVVWLPFEDLVRKLAGNDIRVYFVKDLLFVILLVSVARHLTNERAWRRSVSQAGLPLVALVCWAVCLAVPAAVSDWRVPLLGLRLDFMYAPLVGVGYLLARDVAVLRRVIRVLAALSAVVLALGLVQVVVGPSFLSPGVDTPGLGHLVLYRTSPKGGGFVYRPTGTFVDPGRYASMALIGLAIGLAAYALRRSRQRIQPTSFVVAGLAALAVWASGGRAPLIVGVVLVVSAMLSPSHGRGRGRSRRKRAVLILGGCAIALGLFATVAGSQFHTRLAYYGSTLDPFSKASEWAFRWRNYTGSLVHGISVGKIFGIGTGTQALGLQYLYGGEQRLLDGLYQVESGYGTVAVEWGVIGLGLWLWWTVAWWRRMRHCARAAAGTPEGTVAFILTTWTLMFLFFNFFSGVQYFQNYVSNAYFWLFSGIVFGIGASHRNRANAIDSPVSETV